MKYFSTNLISFDRAINITLKNIKNLNGNPILKELGGYPPKKLEYGKPRLGESTLT